MALGLTLTEEPATLEMQNQQHLKCLDDPSPGLSPKVRDTKRVLDGERSEALRP
jgi:hypothetical protein